MATFLCRSSSAAVLLLLLLGLAGTTAVVPTPRVGGAAFTALRGSRCGRAGSSRSVSCAAAAPAKADATTRPPQRGAGEGAKRQKAPASEPRPPPDANLALQVVVVGGGAVGLYFALALAGALRERVSISLYDGRWSAASAAAAGAKKALSWRPDVSRVRHIVTLQESVWSALPEEDQDYLFPAGSFLEQWPLQLGNKEGEGYPRNVTLSEFEDRLLALLQEPRHAQRVRLCPESYTKGVHKRMVKDDAFHALVLADGVDATGLRDGPLRSSFPLGADVLRAGARGTTQDLLTVLFELDSEAPALNVADATVASLAQRRYLLNARDARSGLLQVLLGEAVGDGEDEAVEDEHAADAGADADADDGRSQPAGGLRAEGAALPPEVLDGLGFFGVPEAAVSSTQRLQSRVSPRPVYHAKMLDCHPPGRPQEMEQPFAFLLGEAADMVDPGPGRGIDASLNVALGLADRLVAARQTLSVGWLVDESSFSEYTRRCTVLTAQDSRNHARRFSSTLRSGADNASAPGPANATLEVDRASFLNATRSLRQRFAALGGRLPPARLEELSEADELLERLAASKTLSSASACRSLRHSGAWAVDEFAFRGLVPEDDELGLGAAAALAPSEPAGGGVVDSGSSDAPKINVKALYNRGVRLLKGKDMEKDEKAAAEAFGEAARHGHTQAQYAYAVMLLKGTGTKKDEKSAAYWFEEASKRGHGNAMYNLGMMCHKGVGVQGGKEAQEKGKVLLTEAAAFGHLKALRSGVVKIWGGGPWMDYDPREMGVEGILREAELGNQHAQFKYGVMLLEGDYVEVDKPAASNWFMKAMKQGNVEAMFEMSRLLFLGEGVEKDVDYAFRIIRTAAEKGHATAQHNLGVKLYFGEDIPLDRGEAGFWFLKAAKQQLPESQNNIGWMLYLGDGVNQDTREGVMWMERAAEANNKEAIYHLENIGMRKRPPGFLETWN